MFRFTEQAFIELLTFKRSIIRLAEVSEWTNYRPLNNGQHLARPTLNGLISNELRFYHLWLV